MTASSRTGASRASNIRTVISPCSPVPVTSGLGVTSNCTRRTLPARMGRTSDAERSGAWRSASCPDPAAKIGAARETPPTCARANHSAPGGRLTNAAAQPLTPLTADQAAPSTSPSTKTPCRGRPATSKARARTSIPAETGAPTKSRSHTAPEPRGARHSAYKVSFPKATAASPR